MDKENSLKWDLLSTEWICNKTREDSVYAQNLYASMCNNDFQKLEVLPILKSQKWHCSWRAAGGIIADMRREGDYLDWYCSGIQDEYQGSDRRQYVPEGTVTQEIREDLKKLKWIVIDNDHDY